MVGRGRAERRRRNRLSWVGSGGVEEAAQRRRRCGESGGEWPQPPVAAAAGMARRWSDHIAAAATPVHVLQQASPVAAAGWGQVEMPAAAGPNHRSLQAQVVVGGEATYRPPAGWAVDVQDVGNLAGDQADVGLPPASPPSAQLSRIADGVVQAVWGQRMLADGPTGTSPQEQRSVTGRSATQCKLVSSS